MRKLVLMGCLLFPSLAVAKPAARHQLSWSSLTGARVGPLGLITLNSFGYRRRLFAREDLLFRSSHVALLGLVNVAPTFGYVGARLQIEPLAILRIFADYEYGGHFGWLGSVQSFPTSQPDVSPRQLQAGAKAGQARPAQAHRFTVNTLLQARFRKLAARYNLQSRYNILTLPPGRKTWFNRTLDILAPNRGWTLVHDIDGLWQLSGEWFAALRYTQVAAMHHDKQGPAPIHRLGPAVVWRRKTDTWSRVDASTLALIVQWHLRHPYRAGQESSAAIPMVQLGWGVTGSYPLASKP